mmetsp:Transcript_47532/g.133806  ORF Transcript_47532/g.133806 Transcript_47532/m.133806 type:complete len:252 (+) Transcript_47532:2-757(+)
MNACPRHRSALRHFRLFRLCLHVLLIWNCCPCSRGGQHGIDRILLGSAASQCAKAAYCENVVQGDQEHPILSGSQPYANSDGSCKHGHAAAQGRCATSHECGLSWHVCTCVSKEHAERELRIHNLVNVTIGLVVFFASGACVCASIIGRYWCPTRSKVSPGNDIEARGPVVVDGVVTSPGILPPTVIGMPIDDVTCGTSAQNNSMWKCGFNRALTVCVTIVFPLVGMSCGIAIFVKGVMLGEATYFNECTT